MDHSLFLRQYKFEVLNSIKSEKPGDAEQKPALLAYFDFESGGFQLEGDYRYINPNTKVKNSRSNKNNNRFLIDAKMQPEIPAGPNDNLDNELLLCLKGSFYNGRRLHRCSGLLRLNRYIQKNKAQWVIYCNLVDNDMDLFEIKLTLPVFTNLVHTPGYN